MYGEKSISGLQRKEYLEFLEAFFTLLKHKVKKTTGWHRSHIIQTPMSAQRFSAVVVAAMHKRRILGATGRYVIILKQEK